MNPIKAKYARVLSRTHVKDYVGARISEHDREAYRNGQVICSFICPPDEIIGKHYWIWYDFTTRQPHCELTSPSANRYVPESFKQHSDACQVSSTSHSQRARTILSSPSFSGGVQGDQGFAGGGGITWPEYRAAHMDLPVQEALRRFRAIKRGQNPNTMTGGMYM